jgi:CheY-like chemotaxis protein
VDSAANGAEALDMLRTIRPDIIVTDIQMPKMGGRQLIMRLKSDPQTAHIPVVILSGKKTSADHVDETRADYFIFKDIDMEAQLQNVLETAFQPAGA